jgi:hypothetical protein
VPSLLRPAALLTAVAGATAACGTNNGPGLLALPSAAELSVSSVPTGATLTPLKDRLVATPTEVYTRVARGALTCWFGAAGALRQDYIYHADAAPPSKGGGAEILIFARDESAQDPRSQRVFQIAITSVDGKTRLEVANLKMPEPVAARMNGDLARWAAGEEGCGERPITEGWSAREVPPAERRGKPVQRTLGN